MVGPGGASEDRVARSVPESDEDNSEPELECHPCDIRIADIDIPEHDREGDNRHSRIRDTKLRRQHERVLLAHDPRSGTNGFWEMRKDPLKTQRLLMHGWNKWMAHLKGEWVKDHTKELSLSRSRLLII